MSTYTITNTISGAFLGAYNAADENGALDAMAREAGYASHLDACMTAPVVEGELRVREVRIPHEAMRSVEWAGVDVADDIRRIVSGEVTPAALLAECVDGCEPEHVADWQDYVTAIEIATGA